MSWTEEECTRFYHSKAWKLKRKAILMRDHYQCVECRRRIDQAREDGTALHGKDAWIRRAVCVHHIKELKDYPDERLDDDNLVSLCHECHDKVHGRDAEGLSHYRYTKKFSPEKEKELSEKW